MFSKNKIVLFLAILIKSGDIFAFNSNVVKYSILNNKKFEQNQSSFRIIKSFNNPDLMNCLMSCSEISNCNAVAKSMSECQLINILTDFSLIQDNQVAIYLKEDNLYFKIVDSKIGKNLCTI